MKNLDVQQRLLSFLREYAAGNDLYWVPLTTLKKDIPVVAYDMDAIYRNGCVWLLEKVFRTCEISKVRTFQTDSMEYFEDDDVTELLYEKDSDGFVFPRTVETFYFDGSEQWLCYVSHEGTISFTGEKMASAAGEILPDKYRI